MGNCKDCKWWGRVYPFVCDIITDAYRGERMEGDSFALDAWALDDSGLECQLRTGPLFGCVKFKKRKA